MSIIEHIAGVISPFHPRTLRFPQYCAHALGKWNGEGYTNSMEALDSSYKAGFRYVEADISYTKDKELVVAHEEMHGRVIRNETLETFLSTPTAGGGTPFRINQLFEYMDEHTDLHVMLDPGMIEYVFPPAEALRILAQLAGLCAQQKCADRIIFEVYKFDAANVVLESGFRNIQLFIWPPGYTRLPSDITDIDVLTTFIRRHGIKHVSAPIGYLSAQPEILRALRETGATIWSGALDDMDRLTAALSIEADIIITPLAPQEIRREINHRYLRFFGCRARKHFSFGAKRKENEKECRALRVKKLYHRD